MMACAIAAAKDKNKECEQQSVLEMRYYKAGVKYQKMY